jgi:thymidylate synthase (FAD)
MNNQQVKLVSVSPNAEEQIAYCARVSNPANQDNDKFAGLLRYCIKHKHWSIFEHAYLTLEINTTLAIATQVLRHRSFTFQQFSQRYADSTALSTEIVLPKLRKQDQKNRQNSTDDLDPFLVQEFEIKLKKHFEEGMKLYQDMLSANVAKECARFVLPQCTMTRLYMSGSVRSWIHYIDLRTANGTQAEHMDLAEKCKVIFKDKFPIISEALEW